MRKKFAEFIRQLAIFVLVCGHGICTTKTSKFKRHFTIPARLATPFTTANEVSLLGCLILCHDEETCRAVNYNAETTGCELVDKKGYFKEYMSDVNEGWAVYSNVKADTIYQRCKTTDSCLEPNSRCIYGSCFCAPMFQYNETERSCKRACETYGDSFTLHLGTYTDGHNTRTFSKITSPEICKQRCLGLGNECQTFEFREVLELCWLSALTKWDAVQVGALRSEASFMTYTRNCND